MLRPTLELLTGLKMIDTSHLKHYIEFVKERVVYETQEALYVPPTTLPYNDRLQKRALMACVIFDSTTRVDDVFTVVTVNNRGNKIMATSVKRAGSKKKCFEDSICIYPEIGGGHQRVPTPFHQPSLSSNLTTLAYASRNRSLPIRSVISAHSFATSSSAS